MPERYCGWNFAKTKMKEMGAMLERVVMNSQPHNIQQQTSTDIEAAHNSRSEQRLQSIRLSLPPTSRRLSIQPTIVETETTMDDRSTTNSDEMDLPNTSRIDATTNSFMTDSCTQKTLVICLGR